MAKRALRGFSITLPGTRDEISHMSGKIGRHSADVMRGTGCHKIRKGKGSCDRRQQKTLEHSARYDGGMREPGSFVLGSLAGM